MLGFSYSHHNLFPLFFFQRTCVGIKCQAQAPKSWEGKSLDSMHDLGAESIQPFNSNIANIIRNMLLFRSMS